MTTPDKTLDTTGLTCPIPVLKARKALKDMATGEVLEILATDPGASRDVAAFCAATGHELVSSNDTDGLLRFLIRCRPTR